MFQLDDIAASHQIVLGAGYPFCLGIGPTKIRGSGYVEAPAVFGNHRWFMIPRNIYATVMIGPISNIDSPRAFIPGAICGRSPRRPNLMTVGDACFLGNTFTGRDCLVGRNVKAQGEVMSHCGAHRLSKKKNFDIPHPTKKGWRLRHTCPEGPSNDVYVRGKINNQTEIYLPPYWKDFVDPDSITVSLTEIGAHQDVIVKRINDNIVYLQSRGGMPINCHYHIFAERIDGEKLIPEYKGDSPANYPGNSKEYSVVGYDYDVEEN